MTAMTTAQLPPMRPSMRGVVHQWSFFVALAAGAALVAWAPAGRPTAAAAISRHGNCRRTHTWCSPISPSGTMPSGRTIVAATASITAHIQRRFDSATNAQTMSATWSAISPPNDSMLTGLEAKRSPATRPTTQSSLLRAKADVNAAQPDGASALAWAVYLGERTMAEALLDAGAAVNTADEYGETPVTLAAANGDAALVRRQRRIDRPAQLRREVGSLGVLSRQG